MAAVETAISDVTVYTDRARVTRKGTAHLGPGEHTFIIERLPTSLQDDSVRAGGRGAGVRILGVEVVREFVTEAPEEDLAELQKQLEALQDKDAALSDEDATLNRRIDFLTNLQNNSSQLLPRGIAYGKTTLDALFALEKHVGEETASAQARKREIGQGRRDLAKEIEVVQRKLEPRWDSVERRSISVSVEATQETDFELEVTYSVLGASWSPLYDIRLIDSGVTVGYLASVQQQSGEDWPAVRLSLSTARPAVSMTIPELDPWYLDVFRPIPYPMAARAALPPMAADYAAGGVAASALAEAAPKMAEPPPAAQMAMAEVENTGASVTFRVGRPTAIPADGTPQKTMITELSLEADIDYVVVPRVAEEAYLRAKVTNSSATILLPGSANIFHGDEFVGTTQLETVVPNEEFEVQLGVDDRVKVERKLTQRSTSKTLIGNTRKTQYGYTITLTNNLDRPARVTLYDQIPVSRHEQIKSILQDVTPPPAEQTEMNILKWELQLAPAQKQEVTFTFQIENPRDMQVTGISI